MKIKVRRGFTLPEVLVTVTVVAVLAAVVVPAVTQFATKGDAPSVQADVNALRTAVTSYITANKTAPTLLTQVAQYASAMNFNGTTATSTATLGDAYALVVSNLLASTPYNGGNYVTVNVSSSNASCAAIDTAIDGISDPSNGAFQYTGAGTANPCTTGKILLLPQ